MGQGNFGKEKDGLKPKMPRVAEQEWGKNFAEPAEDIQRIRERAANQIDEKHPEIEGWANQTYAEDIRAEIKNLSLRKAHGNDGIPGEAY